MLPIADLQSIATARLEDAKALLAAGRYDWTVYTCGYAVECAVKARIAMTLGWPGFPDSPQGVRTAKSFKTHDLRTLLRLTGVEQQIKAAHHQDWSEVIQWNPENRYKVIGTHSQRNATDMVDAAGRLLTAL